jgi:hypothetical protein
MQNTEEQFAVQQKCIRTFFYLTTIRCQFLYLVYSIKVAQSANQPHVQQQTTIADKLRSQQ